MEKRAAKKTALHEKTKISKAEEKALLFGSGAVFTVGFSTSMIGHLLPAALIGAAGAVTLSLAVSRK